MSSRPARAARASASYAHLLQPLSDSDPASSSSDENNSVGGTEEGTDAKGTKQRSNKGKGKGKKRMVESEDEDSEGSVFEIDSDEAAEEEEADNDEEEADPSSPESAGEESSVEGRVTFRKGGLEATSHKAPTSKNREARILASAPANRSLSSTIKPRARKGPAKDTVWGDKTIAGMMVLGPVFSVDELEEEGAQASNPNRRSDAVKAEVNRVFGPHAASARNVGWWKGKINNSDVRWGGWYESILEKPAKLTAVPPEELKSYLPKQVYPSTSKKVYTDEAQDMVDDFDDSDDVEPPSFLKIHIGPISTTSVDQKELKLDRFASTRLDEFYPQKPGYLLNAGGPVTSVSWLPQSDAPNLEKEFLIISTQSEPHLLQHSPATCSASFQLWSIDCSVPSDLSTETDDNKKGVGAKLEYLLALDVGEALDLKWCPRGGGLEEGSGKAGLGIVAGVMTDGSISLFRVPGAEEVRKVSGAKSTPAVNIHPLLALKLPNTSCLSFAWASHETIVAGCINGHVAVWSVKTALDTGVESVWPTHYFPVHMAPIRSVDIIRLPPIGPDGEPDLDGEPESIITCSYDGSTRFIHLNDPSAVGTLSFERTSLYSISFFPFTTSALSADADGNVRAIALKPEQSGITRQITHQRGPIWSIASSDHHAFVATASADGTCVITNGVRGQHKQSHIRKFIHKVLKVDFNRRTGEYRLLDNIMPESRPINDESGATRRRAKASAAQPLQLLASTMDDSLSGAWSPEVGVLRTAWCPQKTRSCLLATGLACGLVKIDWVERVWD